MTDLPCVGGAWPELTVLNEWLAQSGFGNVHLSAIEPWSINVVSRGFVRVRCKDQNAATTGRYEAFYRNPHITLADVGLYNNDLLISGSAFADYTTFYALRWAEGTGRSDGTAALSLGSKM